MADVWKEEVDKGLLDELYKSVRYKNSSGVLVPFEDKKKQVLVRKPEEDFKPEKYPCVSIYNTGDKFSSIRYNPTKRVNLINRKTANVTDRPIPFDLSYNIDFWAKYITDMNVMTKTWLQSHFRQFNLPVVDSNGDSLTVNCLKMKDFVKSDLISGGERLFHSIISYRIWVEIENEMGYNTDVATEVVIDVSQHQK